MAEIRGGLPYFPSLTATSEERCPLASRFINTAEEAQVYYANRLVGEHRIVVNGTPIRVNFNPEEIHLYTDDRGAYGREKVCRPGHSREVRWFNRERARMLDQILPALEGPARAVAAKDARARCVYGPAGSDARRLCVVVGAGTGGHFFVRTAYPVSAKDFARTVRASKASAWPPK